MGYRASIISCEVNDAETLLREVGLTTTDQPDVYNEEQFSGVKQKGKFLLWQNWAKGMLDEDDYIRIAKSVPILTCDLSETTMFSSIRYWMNGTLQWSVWHQGDQDVDDLSVEGDVPSDFASVRDEMIAKQERSDGQVDYIFDIPIALFDRICGFRYDTHDLPFVEVLKTPTPRRQWWKFWSLSEANA